MKRKFYYPIYTLFVKINFNTLFGWLTHYIETFVYFTHFSGWLRKYKPPVVDNKRVDRDHKRRRRQLHQAIFDKNLSQEICYLEFGVASGTSLRWWVEMNTDANSRFFGFDTFEGLPEAWFANNKGDFNQGGNFPDIKDSRIQYIKGLYQDTLYAFLKSTPLKSRKVIHLDADLYSSTLFVLTTLHPYINKGDIIIFDDFAYLMGEFRALEHYAASYYVKYEVIGSVNQHSQLAIQIL